MPLLKTKQNKQQKKTCISGGNVDYLPLTNEQLGKLQTSNWEVSILIYDLDRFILTQLHLAMISTIVSAIIS